MSKVIVLNKSNVIGINNNTYQYNFKQGGFEVKEGSKICVSQFTIPYSWYNISSYLGNNTFSYSVPITTGQTSNFNVVLPDGFYTLQQINTYFQSVMFSNGHYWISSTTSATPTILYPFSFSVNTSYYTNQINFQPVPFNGTPNNIINFFGTGYTSGTWSGGTYPTTTQSCGYINIPSGINTILGFTAGSYTNNNTTTPLSTYVLGNSLTSVSPFPAVGSSVNAIVLRCNLINNMVITPSDILDSIPINSTFGSNINYAPPFDKWVQLKPGKYPNITISLTDQTGNSLVSNDPNILLVLLIKND